MSEKIRIRLTRGVVAHALDNHRAGESRRIWDTEVRQLYLRLTPARYAGYYIRYTRLDGTRADCALAAANIVTPEQARQAAIDRLYRYKIQQLDPVAEKRRARAEALQERQNTFSRVVELYWDTAKMAPSTAATRRSMLRRHILPLLGEIPVTRITQAQIEGGLRSIQARIASEKAGVKKSVGGRRMANMCHDLIKIILQYAVDSLKMDRVPSRGVAAAG